MFLFAKKERKKHDEAEEGKMRKKKSKTEKDDRWGKRRTLRLDGPLFVFASSSCSLLPARE